MSETEICYLKGDATQPQARGARIICHVCNDMGGWGKGFVLALSRRWPAPEAAYRAWHRDRAANDFALGAVQLVAVEPQLWVANLIGQAGIRATAAAGPPIRIRYAAIREGLDRLAVHAVDLQASVHMPRIGCGLAGGTWDRIEPLIRETLLEAEVPVYVYDFA